MSLFATEGLTVRFGGLTALDQVEVGVDEGETVGLIGPNGSGKTTFFNAVTGLVPATGSVRFRGRELQGLEAHAICRRESRAPSSRVACACSCRSSTTS